MTDTKAKILDIAMNLNRMGNWAADGYSQRRERIKTFLDNTSNYIRELDSTSLPSSLVDTYNDFIKRYRTLEKEGLSGPGNPLIWAESMMTWGNILTHRANLIQ
ncbi:hypothetical protein HYZ70_03290 [Candidatus Curtissbacteria bacterium]|nr:hypothetical protein [Candidatus Curtissbacteria bacterium]